MRTAALLIACLCSATAVAQPLTTAFTFQGQVQDSGQPVTGAFDVRFRLYDAAIGGAQVGPTLCVNDLTVSDGRLATLLDFGAVFAGSRRYMEMDIRADTGLACANATGFTTLAPRSEVTAAPNATFALTATNLNSQPASFYTNAGNLTGTLADARLSTNVPRLNTTNTFTNNVTAPLFVGTLSGNATTSTNSAFLNSQPSSFYTNASNINSGTLSELRLPATAALTSNTNVVFQGTVNALQRMNIGNSSTYPEELHIQGTGVFGRIAMDPGGTDQFTELAFWENLSNTNGILLREDGRSISNNLTVIDATSGTEAAIATFDRDYNSQTTQFPNCLNWPLWSLPPMRISKNR